MTSPDSRFTSSRERTLWVLTGLAVGAIYATLELAGSLATTLPVAGLFDAVFGFGAALVLTAVLIAAFVSAERATVGLAVGVGAAYVMLIARVGSPVERTHLVEYGVVALLIYAALSERAAQGGEVSRPALLAVGLASLLGAIDEAIQWVLPSRVFDPIDIAFNVAASVLAVVAVIVVRRARRAPT